MTNNIFSNSAMVTVLLFNQKSMLTFAKWRVSIYSSASSVLQRESDSISGVWVLVHQAEL